MASERAVAQMVWRHHVRFVRGTLIEAAKSNAVRNEHMEDRQVDWSLASKSCEASKGGDSQGGDKAMRR